MKPETVEGQTQWRMNVRTSHDDWTCTHCRKHNLVADRNCGLCGYERVSDEEGIARKRSLYAAQPAAQAGVRRSLSASVSPTGCVCVRNRTTQTLWFYTETTAPVNWVQLRPGEACDLPASGGLVATIAARFEEPDPREVIGTQFAMVFGLLAFPLLLLAPEPGVTKAAAVWLLSLIVTSATGAGSFIVVGVSNQSQLKQVGAELSSQQVWELTDDLLKTATLVSGKVVAEYSYHWSLISSSIGEFYNRFDGYVPVAHGEDRGDLGTLHPINSDVITEIQHHAEIGQFYLDSIQRWDAEGVLSEHVYETGQYGNPGDHEASTISGASTDASGKPVHGLITEVRVAACKFIDAIQVKYNHKESWERVTGGVNGRNCGIFNDSSSTDHLGYGGHFRCGDGEYITRILVWHDIYVVGLQFTTNKNRKSRMFGRRDNDGEHSAHIPNTINNRKLDSQTFDWGGGWVGYRCAYGAWMDAMTFVMADPGATAN